MDAENVRGTGSGASGGQQSVGGTERPNSGTKQPASQSGKPERATSDARGGSSEPRENAGKSSTNNRTTTEQPKKRKRGRPRKSESSKAAGNRNTKSSKINNGNDARPSPVDIDFDSLLDVENVKVKLDSGFEETVGYTFDLLFTGPMLLGFGEHWPLDAKERKELAKRLKLFLESLPPKYKKRAVKFITDRIALLGLLGSLAVITAPRVILTIEKRKYEIQERRKDKRKVDANIPESGENFGFTQDVSNHPRDYFN